MAIAAVVAGALGVASLYRSWRKRPRYRRMTVGGGWTLIAASVWFWIGFGGAEFGPVLAFIQLSLVAWAVVLTNRHVRPDKSRPQQPGTLNLPRVQAMARHAATFVVAVPAAGLSAGLFVLACSMLFPRSDPDRLAFAILTLPVVWGLAVYWTAADAKLLRPAAGIVAIGCASAALIFS
ncbi:MAG: hypothetical protein ACREQ8_11535 [Woeseiaceae bacterium]